MGYDYDHRLWRVVMSGLALENRIVITTLCQTNKRLLDLGSKGKNSNGTHKRQIQNCSQELRFLLVCNALLKLRKNKIVLNPWVKANHLDITNQFIQVLFQWTHINRKSEVINSQLVVYNHSINSNVEFKIFSHMLLFMIDNYS